MDTGIFAIARPGGHATEGASAGIGSGFLFRAIFGLKTSKLRRFETAFLDAKVAKA
jgi:hypothetical protein